MVNNATFIKITNEDIYKKVCEIETHILKTNGNVKLNRWISSTALTLVIGVILALIGIIL